MATGSSTHYTIKFQIKDDDDTTSLSVNTRQDDLIIEFQEDYSIPSDNPEHFRGDYYSGRTVPDAIGGLRR